MDTPVQALLRLEEAHETIDAAGVEVFVFVVLFLMFTFLARLGLRDWRAGGLPRSTRVLVSLFVLGAVSSGAAVPFAAVADSGSRAEAQAVLDDGGLCQRILGDVASGDLRYLERGSVRTVVAECGREAFLVAANAPGSVLSAEFQRDPFSR